MIDDPSIVRVLIAGPPGPPGPGGPTDWRGPFPDNSIWISEDGGLLIDPAASNNIAIGNGALASATTTSTTTAVGNDAAVDHVNGNNNVFLGHSAGQYEIQGTANTYLGAYAGRGDDANPPGQGAITLLEQSQTNVAVGEAAAMWIAGAASGNTLLGFNAGFGMGDAESNVCVGSAAGHVLLTGSRNVCVGHSSYNFGHGDYNVLIGHQAGYGTAPSTLTNGPVADNSPLVPVADRTIFAPGMEVWIGTAFRPGTTVVSIAAGTGNAGTLTLSNNSMNSLAYPDPNTGTGYTINALASAHTGSENVAIGKFAGLDIAGDADQNTLIGAAAGNNMTTADLNLFCGYNSGFSVTTGSSNLVLGAGITVSAATVSNEMNIANGLFSDNIYGSIGTVRIGIGTRAPTALLDVASDTLRLRTAKTPASATALGNRGDICTDSNFIYVCVATNQWRRAPIATW